MKVMIASDGPHAHYYIRIGWAKVMQAMGHQCILWDIHSSPSFDAFDEFEPDIFIGQTYNLDRGVLQCIKERPHLKVVMRASDWGDVQDDIDLEQYPVLTARSDEIDLVGKLMQETGKPDFVYNHYHDKWILKTHNKWESIGVRPVSMLHAADIFEYSGGKELDFLKCDVSFIGGYWPYKARCLDPYLLRLCHPVGKYNIKIYGNQNWPVVQHLGRLDEKHVKDTFCSSTISPNISEPHSQDFGYDIIERPFKVLAAGGFCISDYVQSMAEDVFNNEEIVFAKTPDEFEDKIRYYLRHPEERLPYIKRGHASVLKNHTYFHRVSKIFTELGLSKEASQCMNLLNEAMGIPQ